MYNIDIHHINTDVHISDENDITQHINDIHLATFTGVVPDEDNFITVK